MHLHQRVRICLQQTNPKENIRTSGRKKKKKIPCGILEVKQEKKSKEFESGNKFKLLVAIITLLQDIMLRCINIC